MSQQFETEVMKLASKAILKNVNIEKLVTKALPKLEETIEKDLIQAFKDFDWSEALYDSVMFDKVLQRVTDEVVKQLAGEFGGKSNKKR